MSAVPVRATPASVAHHVDALPPGTRLGEFEVLALLGVGGFGMVYQAFDHSLLRFVAIKEYMPAALAGRADGQSLWVRSSSDAQSYQAGLASFVGEARLLAQFDHPSLVKVFRFWEANHTAYMVMPLYGGMTLKQARAHMRTPPPEAWLRKLLWSVTSALRVLHEGQALHRDISPDNIFLQDAGPPVLLDLGAARHVIGDGSQRLTSVLKVNYAPIEQYTDAGQQLQQGPWSDLYSLGAVVHGCLCNDTPLPATLRAIRDRMVPFSRVARTVRKQFGVEYSRPFIDAVAHSLQLQPQDRPQTIDAFLQEMGMTEAPAGLEHFDFRAELADVWVEPSSKDAQGVASDKVIDLSALSQPYSPPSAGDTVPEAPVQQAPEGAPAFAETVAVDWDTTAFADTRNLALDEPAPRTSRAGGQRLATEDPGHPGAGQPPRRAGPAAALAGRARLMGAMAASLLVLLAVAWWWGQQQQRPRYTPESEIITELAPPPLPPPPLPLSPPPEAAQDEAVDEAGAAASEAAAALQPAAPAPRPRAPRRVEEAPRPPPAPEPVVQAPAPPEPRPAASRAAPPARVAGPQEACASASFLARPLCIHEQCQTAALAGHPVCVAARRQREEAARQQQMYPQ
ncbi:serine/threonine protein kinase [Pulveribacter suum]|uniref:Serine/threonine protein kinase n=1 Tax=Pulveribacter suum TaxID=2116657 RepID=A0A2P1NP84_9BURK|nr:serine/threonine-protein kinase [Pulveribacter suum]AVP58806.1 serine/threonine protein kinase [Pulveribacter suum]